jgi:ribosomal protein S18 acetylase RimI-like enzyme
MGTWVVRAASEQDKEQIRQVCLASRRATLAPRASEETVARTLAMYCSPARIEQEMEVGGDSWPGWQVAVSPRGEVVGAAAGGLTQTAVGEVYELHVDPDRMRRGVGSRLLEELSVRLHKLGARDQWASTYEHNTAGRAFLERNGFTLQETFPPLDRIGVEEGLLTVRYRRPLEP